ncbi:hypothetical protein PTNB73_03320 [Pyrenophora teres f. teres]|nr:hypothetical protein HRS9122_04079 [Pyrenophora teres f. teres]KAE8871861.1 hypothetical protein PTNB73_03320 [Pyrenophora teres f. teres]
MKLTLALLLLSTTTSILANPARPDCGQTKTFTASNDCGLSYGGTWIACASGIRAIPTFTVPACPHISTSSPTTPTHTPTITPLAVSATSLLLFLHENRKINTTTTSCRRQMICIDVLTSCGGTGTRFGGE